MRKDLLFVGTPFGDMRSPLLFVGYYIYDPIEKILYIEDSGAWKKVLNVFVEHDGIWKQSVTFVGNSGAYL